MPRYKVLSPIKVGGEIARDGEVEMSARHAADALARGELELVKEAKPKNPPKTGDNKPDENPEKDPPKDPANAGDAK